MLAVSLILLKQGDNFLLQHRDDIPNIADPGLISPWGGDVEGDETGLQAAVRELQEETGVVVSEQDLVLLKDFEVVGKSPEHRGESSRVYMYYIQIDTSTEVMCFEGQGIFTVTKLDDVPRDKQSSMLITIMSAYRERKKD